MAPRRPSPPDDLRIALARALGYPDYPTSLTAEPCLNYVTNHRLGRGTSEEYLGLFIRVIEHFRRNGADKKTTPMQNSIHALLDNLMASKEEKIFADTEVGSRMRKEVVEDTVMYILGVWTMMLGSFVRLPNGFRKVTMAYCTRTRTNVTTGAAFAENLAGLIHGSGLLPAPGNHTDPQHNNPNDEIVRTAMKLVALLAKPEDTTSDSSRDFGSLSNSSVFEKLESNMSRSQITYRSLENVDSLESLSIKATRLNAFTLNALGAVEISWTHNVSCHMLLSQRGGRCVLQVFALPCAFKATSLASDAVGISSDLTQEIQESYGVLFNAWPDLPLHAKLGRFLGFRKFCWCWSCSAYRYRQEVIFNHKKSFFSNSRKATRTANSAAKSEFDHLLIELMSNNVSPHWTCELFPSLWPRIISLEEHLQKAKPWSIWILFRDRRDTLQFWTFFFATVIVLLTILQVALGIAQAVGSFK